MELLRLHCRTLQPALSCKGREVNQTVKRDRQDWTSGERSYLLSKRETVPEETALGEVKPLTASSWMRFAFAFFLGYQLLHGSTLICLYGQIMSLIGSHVGETVIRARFADYVLRFTRLAARYEEDNFGSTKIGFPTRAFGDQLGSGTFFIDDASRVREMAGAKKRIEAWRGTKTYEFWKIVR